jgi:UDP-N-acetylglucosamine pyrophosphorylase
MDSTLAVVIMAAGKGTRMNNPHMAKVMYSINHRPMIDYVVDLAIGLRATKTIAVVGWKKESVIEHFAGSHKEVVFAEQSPQLGTGHAVMQAQEELRLFDGEVLVLSGDVPLLSKATVSSLIRHHRKRQACATILTAELEHPAGYGRIIRRSDGQVTRIVEHKDATEEERKIREINSGIYVFNKKCLFGGLKHLKTENAQHEYYLTDVFGYFWRHHFPVYAIKVEDIREIQGINTPEQLEEARQILAQRG